MSQFAEILTAVGAFLSGLAAVIAVIRANKRGGRGGK
jgi:hypothetical protein